MKKLIFSQGSGSFRWDCWWSLQFSVTSLAALRPIPPAVVFSRDDQTHSIIALTITVGQLCYNDEVLYGLHKGFAHGVGNCKRISLPVESPDVWPLLQLVVVVQQDLDVAFVLDMPRNVVSIRRLFACTGEETANRDDIRWHVFGVEMEQKVVAYCQVEQMM